MSEWLVDETGWIAVAESGTMSGAAHSAEPALAAHRAAPYPMLARPTVALWWPPRCVFGVHAFEGKPRHAAALVERRLRSEGVIELGAKIFVPRVDVLGKLCQSFYMAVSGEEWRRMMVWESTQAHQCLVVPVLHAALALKGSADLVVILGRTEVVVLGMVRRKAIHLNAVLFGTGEAEWVQALANLADRLKDLLGPADGPQPVRATCLPWCFEPPGRAITAPESRQSSSSPAMDGGQGMAGAGGLLHSLMADFARISGIQCSVMAHAFHVLDAPMDASGPGRAVLTPEQRPALRDDDRLTHASGFVQLGIWKPIQMCVNAMPAKRAALASAASPLLTMALTLCLAFSVGVGVNRVRLGMTLQEQARELEARARAVSAAAGTEPVADALQADAQRDMAFVDVLARADASLDVLDAMIAVRNASVASEMRILGLRLEEQSPKAVNGTPAMPGAAGADAPANQESLVVDGRFASQTLGDSRANADFSRAMAAAGYAVRPLEIKGAIASMSDSSRLFSYRLTKAQ